MRKLLLVISLFLLLSQFSYADDYDMFINHGSVMLIINPDTGDIVFANHAAAEFYGCSIELLQKTNISEINTLTAEEIKIEMTTAKEQHRNYFKFIHQLCDGSLRYVEVYSYPIRYMEEDMLFSIVIDVTEKMEIETELQIQNEQNRDILIDIIYAILIVLFVFVVMSLLILKSNRKLKYLSEYDPLTKVLNRVVCRDKYVKLCERNKYPIAFFMIDVNNLKFINDTFGHIIGDEMIIAVAKALSKISTNKSILSRVSGDEFVLVIPDLDYKSADIIEKRIEKIAIKLKNIHFNVSVGKIVIDKLLDYDTAFSIAESNMYTDKALGREDNNLRIEREMLYYFNQKYPEFERQTKCVSDIVKYFTKELELIDDEVDDLLIAVQIQDIGLSVESDHENAHPEKGASILHAIGKSHTIINTVLHHHEHYDGSGYPKGLKGQDIPLTSRILLISNQIYKMLDKSSIEDAIRIIELSSASKYDPELIKLINKNEFKTLLYDITNNQV